MLRFLTLILAVTAPILGRTYNNPILGEGGDFADPGAIKVDTTYYIVTSTNDTLTEKMRIVRSTDLISWQQTGYIFDKSNIPRWSVQELPFLSPKIHLIGKNYHVYFTATDSTTKMQSIGVAVAPHPLGPYTPTDRPLLSYPDKHVNDASIIDDKDNLFLIYVTSNAIKGRKLNSNGLSFYATYSTELIRISADWTSISGPFYTTRGPYHYLLYSQNDYNNQTLQVARSSYPMGPYEKYPNALLVSNDDFKNPGHPSLVKDLGNSYDLIVYHALRGAAVGSSRVIMLSTLLWGTQYRHYGPQSEEWPSISDTSN